MNKYLKLAREAYQIADSKKALKPALLNVARLTAVADYFLIVTGESSPQIKAIAESIYKTFRDSYGILPAHRDGIGSMNWSVIDYGGLVVHIMNPESRNIYALEKIWHAAKKVSPVRTRRAPKQ